MDKLVDFSQPIEAVHWSSGKTRSAKVEHHATPDLYPCVTVEGFNFFCPVDDYGFIRTNPDWRIRNTVKPSAPSNEELTQRMEKAGVEAIVLLREIAEYDNSGDYWAVGRDTQRRILAFLADLPKPVDPIDPDEEAASRLAMTNIHEDFPTDTCGLASWVLKGIKLGRTLAAGGTAHE